MCHRYLCHDSYFIIHNSYHVARKRLDEVLCKRGIANGRQEAFIIVTAGRVFVNGQRAVSPAQPVDDGADVAIRGNKQFVGRGGLKLDAACEAFSTDVADKVCLDVGAATGGFTDVLLRRGAKRVYAVDTARGKIAQSIRDNPAVVLMERTDIRNVAALPEPVDFVAIDVSLISLREILPAISRLVPERTTVVALFKPQYETRNPRHLKNGVVRSDAIRDALASEFEAWVTAHQWNIAGRTESPIRGNKGNVEYLYLLKR